MTNTIEYSCLAVENRAARAPSKTQLTARTRMREYRMTAQRYLYSIYTMHSRYGCRRDQRF